MNNVANELFKKETESNIPAGVDSIHGTEIRRYTEALVRECAKVAAGLQHVHPRQAQLTADCILEHFGIEGE